MPEEARKEAERELDSTLNFIQLDGTMGPPTNFNPATGSRTWLGSAYCLGGTGAFFTDVLLYHQSGPSMDGASGSGTCVPQDF